MAIPDRIRTARPATSEPKRGKPISTCGSFPRAVVEFFARPCVAVVWDYRLNRRVSADAKSADAAALWALERIKDKGRGLVGMRATVTPEGAAGSFVLRQSPNESYTWRWLPVEGVE